MENKHNVEGNVCARGKCYILKLLLSLLWLWPGLHSVCSICAHLCTRISDLVKDFFFLIFFWGVSVLMLYRKLTLSAGDKAELKTMLLSFPTRSSLRKKWPWSESKNHLGLLNHCGHVRKKEHKYCSISFRTLEFWWREGEFFFIKYIWNLNF